MDGLRQGALTQTRRLGSLARDVTAVARAIDGGYWLGTRQGLEKADELRTALTKFPQRPGSPDAETWAPNK